MFSTISVSGIVATATPFVAGLAGVVLIVIAYRVTLRIAGYVIARFSH